MSSWNADKKREHETLAAQAYAAGDFEKASFHTMQAAEYTLNLAKQCDGEVAKAYEQKANELRDEAITLKKKAEKTQRENKKTNTNKTDGTEELQSRWPVEQDTHVRFDDVIGLEEAKEIVQDALIYPQKHPDIYKTLNVKPVTGLLLYGPPRSGKTMFARAIAGELKCPFINVDSTKLIDMYVGNSEKNIASVFEAAFSYDRCVLFFDDCEYIMAKRSGEQKVNSTGQFLTQLDGFDKHKGKQLFVVIATNLPWALDSAILESGRISSSVYVGLPNREARKQLIVKATEGIPLAEDVDIDKLADLTDGYVSAQISHKENGGAICEIARNFAARRWIERRENQKKGSYAWSRVETVTWADFEEAMKQVVPASISQQQSIADNLKFRDARLNR